MLNLAEYRHHPAGLADFLPWAALVAPGVVLNKDGSFQRTARFRGPDLDSATPAELVGVTARLNNALRRLGSGWALFVEADRLAATDYPESKLPDAASALLDLERQDSFEQAGVHFESRYYLTFLWLPPAEEISRAEAWLYEGKSKTGVDPHELLRGFIDRTDRVLQLVEGFVPEVGWLDDGETLTFLHSTISTKRQRVRVPEIPMYLDVLLTDQPLTGGLEPRLGTAHLRTLSIVGFPTATHPGILDELNRLAFPYRWTTRAILLDKTEAVKILTRVRRQWFAKRKSITAILKEVMTNEASVLVDSDAANKAADADAALQELGADDVGEAYLTATVTVWDEDAGLAAEKLRLVEKVIQGRDFTCMTESLNAVEAWLGSLPGHVYANVRQPPVSTLNLAHMIPLSAVWAGPEKDAHLDAPPLFFAKTEGSTPFRFCLHVGDVGHTLIVGPTGAGKSVLLALMALQFRRYPKSQVFTFDFGGSIRAAALANQPTIEQALSVVLAALALLGLGIFGPGIATGLVSGAPQLGAGAAVGTGLAVGAAAIGAGAAVASGGAALAGAGRATAAAARGTALTAGAASTAYSLGATGQSGMAGVASGLAGVGKAAGNAAISPIKQAMKGAAGSLKERYQAGARSAFTATGGSSTMGSTAASAGETSSASGGSSPPAWAQRMRRNQAMSHGVTTVAHAVRSGDSGGGGHSVDLSERG